MDKRTLKDDCYTAIARTARAFSNSNRLEVLDLLANGEKSVEQIAVTTSITIANASHHLQILKNANLVRIRKEKNFIYYSLTNQEVYVAWKAIKDFARIQQPELELALREFRKSKRSEKGIHYKEITKHNKSVLLDVRPADEFEAGHIKNAHSIPIHDLAKRLKELPKNKIIIAYCRGTFCTYADEAVQFLKKNGFKAIRLEESFLDVQLNNGNYDN